MLLLLRLEEEPEEESASSTVSTGDKGVMMGDSGRDFRDDFSWTLIVSFAWTVMAFAVSRSGRDWLWTIRIRREDMTGCAGQSLLTQAGLGLSGFLGGTDGG